MYTQSIANISRHKVYLVTLDLLPHIYAPCYSYHRTLLLLLPYSFMRSTTLQLLHCIFFEATTQLRDGLTPHPWWACPFPWAPVCLLSFILLIRSPSLGCDLSSSLSLFGRRVSLASSVSFTPLVHDNHCTPTSILSCHCSALLACNSHPSLLMAMPNVARSSCSRFS